ncbi:autotransporter domain-containing protein [Aerophototrophica crusticola]|uniref:Autotransporter domain-containing protein n=1 Tax=Aerophototrophica crusticola TaxID=1709002 RepID=A0A858R385_9PROT|nr:autotransporter domain-containing protein [Rhodospirillaceae bacterium B3]
MLKRILMATAAAAVAGLAVGAAGAQQLRYSGGTVFGDSLSDTDNFARFLSPALRPGAPYVNGRFSNGPVWLETFGSLRGITMDSRAFGGARAVTRNDATGLATDLTPQVDRFLAGGTTVASDRLVAIWIGGNDYVGVLSAPTPPSTAQVQATIANVANTVATQAGRLYAAGARNFVLVDLPPLGNIPLTSGLPAATRASANQVSDLHSLALAGVAAGLRTQGANAILVDVNGLFRDLLARPSAYGFTNTTIPCFAPVGPGGSLVATGACATAAGTAGTVFFDALHPTTTAHALTAAFVDGTLSAAYEAPSAIATTTQLGIRLFEQANQAIAGRMFGARGGQAASLSGSQMGPDGRFALYAFGSYFKGDAEQRGNQFGYDYDGYNGGVGVDYEVDQNVVAGLAFAYGKGKLDTDGDYAEVDAKSYSVTTYVTAAAGELWGDAFMGYSFNKYDIDRQTRFAFAPTASAEPDGDSYGAGLTVGYTPSMGGLAIGPVASLRYVNTEVDGFTEQGSNLLNLKVEDFDAESLKGSLGVSATGRFGSGGTAIVPTVHVAYEREFLNDDRKVFGTLPSGQPAFANATSPARNQVVGGIGLGVNTGSIGLSLGWEGRFGGSIDDNSFSARVRVGF